MMARIGDYIQTFSGRKFYPLDPRPEEIFIEDIAHALAMSCRYNGHCLRFYSVAEHSVLMSYSVQGNANKLWALLHDASEAYIADVSRPVKGDLIGYKEIEARIMQAVCVRFGLTKTMPDVVKDLDNAILLTERVQNMHLTSDEWGVPGEPLAVNLRFWTPREAERYFMMQFLRLYDGV